MTLVSLDHDPRGATRRPFVWSDRNHTPCVCILKVERARHKIDPVAADAHAHNALAPPLRRQAHNLARRDEIRCNHPLQTESACEILRMHEIMSANCHRLSTLHSSCEAP